MIAKCNVHISAMIVNVGQTMMVDFSAKDVKKARKDAITMIDSTELAKQIVNDLHYALMDESRDYHVDKEQVVKDAIDYYLDKVMDDGK